MMKQGRTTIKHTRCLLIANILAASVMTASAPGQTLVPAGWDAALAGDLVLERLITATASQTKGAHDAEMVLVKDRAYIVAEVNDVRAGESAGWPET